MTHGIDLVEYQPKAYALSADELYGLQAVRKELGLTIELADGQAGVYTLTPGSTVGAVEVDGLSIVIHPKITMQQVLSLALYAIGADDRWWRSFNFTAADALPDLLALALASAARRAFARGLLHGYRTEEEALYGVRGRIRFDDQVRRRFGRALPIEARYDDFTDDILENRLVKAAAGWLAMMRLRSPAARRGLGWIAGTLANVSPVEYPLNNVPEVRFDRLNEHYRQVVTLARLVLRHTAYQSSRGATRAVGFLFDMNDVFQRFVTRALRGKLQLSERAFPSDKKLPQKVTLDTSGQLNLLPDLSWWQDGKCVFVGDAKYKRILDERVPNADLYQLLAYATALNLPNGLLIYAEGEANVASHTVRYANKQLEVTALDLNGNLDDVLERVGYLANRYAHFPFQEAYQSACELTPTAPYASIAAARPAALWNILRWGNHMEMLRKPVAVYLALSALAVLVHFWLSPFYPDSWDVGVIWEVVDVFMAVGIVVTLAYTFSYKRGVGSDAGTLAHVCAYTAFYASAVLAVLFFWNWFDDLTVPSGEQSDTRLIFWPVINTMYIVLMGTVGWRLWRK